MHFTAIFRATASGFSNEVPNYLFYPKSRGGNITRNCGLFYSICTVIFLAAVLSNIRKRLLMSFSSMQHLFCNLNNIFWTVFSSTDPHPSRRAPGRGRGLPHDGTPARFEPAPRINRVPGIDRPSHPGGPGHIRHRLSRGGNAVHGYGEGENYTSFIHRQCLT